MTMKNLFKSWKTFVKDDKGTAAVTSSATLRHKGGVKDDNGTTGLTSSKTARHKKVTFEDRREEKWLQGKEPNRAYKSKARGETKTPSQSRARVKGRDKVFSFEDEDDDDDDDDEDDHENNYERRQGLRVEYSHQLGGKGKAEGRLQDATDVQCTDHNHIVVTDLVNSRLQLLTRSGEVTKVYQCQDLQEPWACALSPDGQLMAVTCRRTRQVALVGREDGKIRGRLGNDPFPCPSGLAVTSQGHWLVTDTVSGKVSVFDADGSFLRHLGSAGDSVTLEQPRYVTVSSRTGDIIVSDSGNHRLVIYDRDGNFLKTVGSFGKGDGCLKFPHGVCTDATGNILVCDRYNDRVSLFSRRGDFVRHLVTSEHQLRHPQGLALSRDLDLYVTHGGLKAHSVMVLRVRPRH